MKLKNLFLIMVMAMISFPILADSNQTILFTVSPKMVCGNCENKIKSNLRFEKGVKSIETSLSDQTVKITFNPAKTSEKKLIEAFGKIGYSASVADAKEGAAESCESKCCGKSCEAAKETGCCQDARKQEANKQGCCQDKESK